MEKPLGTSDASRIWLCVCSFLNMPSTEILETVFSALYRLETASYLVSGLSVGLSSDV